MTTADDTSMIKNEVEDRIDALALVAKQAASGVITIPNEIAQPAAQFLEGQTHVFEQGAEATIDALAAQGKKIAGLIEGLSKVAKPS